VGHYEVGDGFQRAFSERWNGSGWTLQRIPAPSDMSFGDALSGVACTSADACTAVGSYDHDTLCCTSVPLAERWDGTSWAVQTIPGPAQVPGSWLDAVSCSSATSCAAVGASRGPAGGDSSRPLAEEWDGANWSIQSTPRLSGAGDGELYGVSCISTAACTAVGNTLGRGTTTLAERWNGSSWSIQDSPNINGKGP
jgi:hypothetical protein